MNSPGLVYLDNAATSWPKPPEVLAAMAEFFESVGANPGRAAHRLSVQAARIVYSARDAIALLFGASDPLSIAFCHNATDALNTALKGLLKPGDHVITSSMEHNAVMRPLRALERNGVSVSVVRCSPDGLLDPDDIERCICRQTKLICLNHASNVVGTLLPIGHVGAVARRHDVLLLVDAAQTAGACTIDMNDDAVDLLAFTGHKSLLGPTGTGGLIVGERVDLAQLEPLRRGGTGSSSQTEEQPDFLPDMLEGGTLNVIGLAGLSAGIDWINTVGPAALRSRERGLTQRLIDGLKATPGVTVYGTGDAARQTATVSFNIAGSLPSDVGLALDQRFGVLCRVGLHCAPAAHKTIGTFPTGTVRFGLGPFTTADQIDGAVSAVACLAVEGK